MGVAKLVLEAKSLNKKQGKSFVIPCRCTETISAPSLTILPTIHDISYCTVTRDDDEPNETESATTAYSNISPLLVLSYVTT